jgi:hypothetical protein
MTTQKQSFANAAMLATSLRRLNESSDTLVPRGMVGPGRKSARTPSSVQRGESSGQDPGTGRRLRRESHYTAPRATEGPTAPSSTWTPFLDPEPVTERSS